MTFASAGARAVPAAHVKGFTVRNASFDGFRVKTDGIAAAFPGGVSLPTAKAVAEFSNTIPGISDASESEIGVPAVALVPLSVTDAAYAFVPVPQGWTFTPAPKTVLPVVTRARRVAPCAGGRAVFQTTAFAGFGVGVGIGVGVGPPPPADGEPPPPQPPNNNDAETTHNDKIRHLLAIIRFSFLR
jgi:hypothetical protein